MSVICSAYKLSIPLFYNGINNTKNNWSIGPPRTVGSNIKFNKIVLVLSKCINICNTSL